MKKLVVYSLVGVAALSLMGCGSSASKYDVGSYATEEAAYDYAYDDFAYESATAMSEEYEGENGANASAETVGENAVSTRKLITTVTIDAEATDFGECAANVKAKVDQYNGYIESESCGETSGNFTIRIPSKNLDAFLENIHDYSNVTYYTSSVEDVTLNYVDIEARISALRTEQQRLEEFMSQAETVEDIITIEDRLSEVRYELQSYESQKRTYDNKIDYSTVHLNISQVSTYTPPTKATIGERIKAGLSENIVKVIEKMGDVFVGIVVAIPVIFIALIPVAIIFCVIYFPVNAKIKKREAKRRAENEAKAQNEKSDEAKEEK